MDMTKATTVAAFVTAVLGLGSALEGQQPPAPAGGKDQLAALKQSMQQGMKLIRQYEWVETTIISVKGEEKSRKQNQCYYGADGKVQKVPIGAAPPPQQQSGGGRGRGGRLKEQVVENKKDDMQDYMERAGNLIHQYVPPSPDAIQVAQNAGRVAISPQPEGRVNIKISQYLLAGDALTIDLDGAANRMTALGVNTYLDKPDEQVTLAVQMSALPDGAIYAAKTTLEAKAKNITVVVQNSGHRPMAR